MSTYPGENPQAPDGQPSAEETTPDSSEPTQPVGYWEQHAAEQRRQDSSAPYPQSQGPAFNPTSGQPSPGGGDQPYGGPSYGSQPYGQPGFPPPPGQPPYYPPPGVPGQPSYGAFAPAHPQSTLAMVLGLVGLVGAVFACGLTLVVSPFAWAIGRRSLREIEASQGRLGGESSARTGMILGIVGTVLLVIAILVLIAFVVLLVAGTTTSGSSI